MRVRVRDQEGELRGGVREGLGWELGVQARGERGGWVGECRGGRMEAVEGGRGRWRERWKEGEMEGWREGWKDGEGMEGRMNGEMEG